MSNLEKAWSIFGGWVPAIIGVATLLALALLTAGCTGIGERGQAAAAGQASYELQRSAEGDCRVRVTSGRDVATGWITVDKDCSLGAGAEALNGQEVQMRLIDRLLEKLP